MPDSPVWVVVDDGGTWWFRRKREARTFIAQANKHGKSLPIPITITSDNYKQLIGKLLP